MSSHPMYTRETDTRAYRFGARFMARLNNHLDDGLVDVLSEWFSQNQATGYEPITTESFLADIESISGKSLVGLFDKHVYGLVPEEESIDSLRADHGDVRAHGHSIHKKMNAQTMMEIL